MVDERDRPLSSEELLRAAREGSRSGDSLAKRDLDDGGPGLRPTEAEERRRRRDSGDDVGGSAARGRTYRLTTSARLLPSGTWWAKLRREEYSLHVDGEHVGRVLTSMGRDDVGFGGVARLRRTMVVLPDGVSWRITVDPPGPKRTKTTVFGNVKQLPHQIDGRVVVAHDGGRRLAWTEGPLGTRRGDSGVVATDKRSYELSPIRKGRAGAIGSFATVERERAVWLSPWLFASSEELPLSVALVHWHLLMGDWAAESQSSGG
jgi:hypothetical protein